MQDRLIRDITAFIFIEDAPIQADVIFIPGGSHPALGEAAAALYHAGLAKYVMPSGGVSVASGKFAGVKDKAAQYDKAYATDCDFLVDVLMQNGVPEGAILREDASGHTKENAQFSRRVADGAGLQVRTAILCAKSFHARRALMSYQLAFPEAVFCVRPVDCTVGGVMIRAEDWHRTEVGVRKVMGEVRRCGAYFVEDLIE